MLLMIPVIMSRLHVACVQGSAKRLQPRLVNFVAAVAHYSVFEPFEDFAA